jgi:hypothetical protein
LLEYDVWYDNKKKEWATKVVGNIENRATKKIMTEYNESLKSLKFQALWRRSPPLTQYPFAEHMAGLIASHQRNEPYRLHTGRP